MSTKIIPPAYAQRSAAPATQTTARLIAAGTIAGPLFLAVWALQAFTRDSFDPDRHPISLLSLGDLGWIQIANFVVTGALVMASAAGLRRVLQPGRGAVWGPRLIGGFGAGLIMAGIFVTDAGAGFPAGAPAGAPEMSWHGALHEMGYVLSLISWTAACFVLRARFAVTGQRGWARACVATVVIALLVGGAPDPDSLPVRLVIATAVQFALVAAVAARLRRTLPDTGAITSGTR
jgi:Protein of unknown function (DUF998)